MSALTITAPQTLVDVWGLGRVVLNDGIIYVLTTCCEASGKGGERAVICRACHQPVPEVHGWAALQSDPNAREALASILEPTLEHLAALVAARAIDKADSMA